MFASDPIARHVDAELLPGRDVQTDDELIAYSKLMPVMPSANTMAPTLMVGEKAADMILGRARLPAVALRD